MGGVKNTLCNDWSGFSAMLFPATNEDCPAVSEEDTSLFEEEPLFFFIEWELLVLSLSTLPFFSFVDFSGESK